MVVIWRSPDIFDVLTAPFRFIWKALDSPCKLDHFALNTVENILARAGTNTQEDSVMPFVIISQWFLRSGLVAASLNKSNKSAVE